MSIESIGKFVMALAVVASLTVGYPQTSNAQINDKVSRNNGAPFFAKPARVAKHSTCERLLARHPELRHAGSSHSTGGD